MNRKEMRDFAIKIFYEMDIHKSFDEDTASRLTEQYAANSKDDYLIRVTTAFVKNKARIDETIERNSISWALNRIAKMDLSILRMSFTEILFLEDIPEKVTVNEAVELAKVYGDEKSYKFVNGILGNLLQEGRLPGE